MARIISPLNPKAKRWVNGRKNIFEQLEKAFANNTNKVLWMHCASLGEFEQGRPIVEQLKKENINLKVLITFFSPSGFEVQKNYAGADWVFYLPMDNASNAKRFLNITHPSLIVFVKYEFWYYYLQRAKQLNIPLLLVSGVFRGSQPFFKWYGSLYREMLACFTHLFVQDINSISLLKNIKITKNVLLSGDTRFDRVTEIANNVIPVKLIEQFIQNRHVIIAGSTWLDDDKELVHFVHNNPSIVFIIAPHDVQEKRLEECKGLYKDVVLWSELTEQNITIKKEKNILIIDIVGMLSSLYKYASICYIGGGFGDDGVHNVLEAAVFGKPVIFGPIYEKYLEAIELIEVNGGFSINTALELEALLNNLLNNETLYAATCKNAGNFVQQKTGATATIINTIYEKRLLTN